MSSMSQCFNMVYLAVAFTAGQLTVAGSTGRRNTCVKSLCWGFKLQGLTWPFVELTRHLVQIGLRVHRQVSALRKVLSQQTIGFSFDPRCHGLCGSQK